MNLSKILVLNMSEVLENSYCTVYFDNFFNSPLLISKLLKKWLYGVGYSQSNRKGMPKLMQDCQIKREDLEFQFSPNVTDGMTTDLLFCSLVTLKA